jgi:hypothetical protein
MAMQSAMPVELAGGVVFRNNVAERDGGAACLSFWNLQGSGKACHRALQSHVYMMTVCMFVCMYTCLRVHVYSMYVCVHHCVCRYGICRRVNKSVIWLCRILHIMIEVCMYVCMHIRYGAST